MSNKFKAHISVLGLIKESQIGLGRQLLADVITGDESARIKKLRLDKLIHFSTLPLYDKKDVFELLDLLLYKKFIEYKPIPNNKFIKVLSVTAKGEEELKNPSEELKLTKSFEGYYSTFEKITDEDKIKFEKLGNILTGLSDEQKKAVIHSNKNILCIAGAGSGKTRVLTKRAWYLAQYKSIPQDKILAVTFTRKARKEMQNRLEDMIPGNLIQIETFNSFCEKYLRKYEDLIYNKKVNVMSYRKRLEIFVKILKELNLTTDAVLNKYYSKNKIYSNDKKTLFFGLINDMFSVLDYQRNNDISFNELMDLISGHYDYQMASTIKDIIRKIVQKKDEDSLRDYTDQIVHTIEFFKKNQEMIPRFDHVLIDEYQDVNSLQFEFIQLLKPNNLFSVGDPRQSIYGWRGSRIDYILDFEKLFPGSSILQLSTNYRSNKEIVELCNNVIGDMKLPDLKSFKENGEKTINFVKHKNDDIENAFVAQSILSQNCKRNEIFVLARTNKQIEKLSLELNKLKIRYLKRTIEEKKTNLEPTQDEITLSTIHAIKGLEASVVYFIGAGAKNHPCKANEHPVLEAVKINDTYDKYAEELRLFYVSISRPQEKLIISYTGTLASYVKKEIFDKFNKNSKIKFDKSSKKEVVYKTNNSSSGLYHELKSWRLSESQRLNCPPYYVFNDRTLDELCSVLPSNFEELQEVSGFGPVKVKRFGKDIVRIVMENC